MIGKYLFERKISSCDHIWKSSLLVKESFGQRRILISCSIISKMKIILRCRCEFSLKMSFFAFFLSFSFFWNDSFCLCSYASLYSWYLKQPAIFWAGYFKFLKKLINANMIYKLQTFNILAWSALVRHRKHAMIHFRIATKKRWIYKCNRISKSFFLIWAVSECVSSIFSIIK